MGAADQLVDEIFSWIDQREGCATQLRKLAKELESLRQNCNSFECVGSSVSVLGITCLIGAGVATLFTGGLAAPLAALGTAYAVAGSAVSVTTKISEHFLSSSTMEDAMKIEKRSNGIAQTIRQLFQELKNKSGNLNSDEVDQHVMIEILQAVARRSGIKLSSFRDIETKLGLGINEVAYGGEIMRGTLQVGLIGILAFFSLQASGKTFKLLFGKIAEELIMTLTKMGVKSVLKGGALVLGTAFVLSEAIDIWKDMIKNNHVTEASQSLRDAANEILKVTQTLKSRLNHLEKMVEQLAREEEQERIRRYEEAQQAQRIWQEQQNHKTMIEELARKEEQERIRRYEEAQRAQRIWQEQQNHKKMIEELAREEEKERNRRYEEAQRAQRIGREKQNDNMKTLLILLLVRGGFWRLFAKMFNANMSQESAMEVQKNQKTNDESYQDKDHSDRKEQTGSKQEKGNDGSDQGGGGDQNGDDKYEEEEESNEEDEESDSEEQEEDPEKKKKKKKIKIKIKIKIRIKTKQTQNNPITENSGEIQAAMLNVHSLTKRTSRIRDLIRNNRLDVFLSTETWLREDTGDNLLMEASPEHYNFIHAVRGSRGGGVGAQFCETFQSYRIFFDFVTSFEYVAIALQHDEWEEPIVFINIYHRPGFNLTRFYTFCVEFERVLDEVRGYSSLVVTGDFNIHVDNGRKTSSRLFRDLMVRHGLHQHVDEPTFRRANHTLDLIITRNVNISFLFVQDDGISDHYTVYFNMKPKDEEKDETPKRFKDNEE